MAKRPTINTLANTASPTYLTQLNQNFTNIQDQFDNTLSLDGSTPNAMNADLDLNGNDLINAGSVNTATLRIGGQAVVASDAVNQTVKKEFETVALLLADTGTYTNYAAGDYFRVVNGGFSYQVAASGASDHHVTTAGGVKLYVLPSASGQVTPLQFRAYSASNNSPAIQAAIDYILDPTRAVGGEVFIPAGSWPCRDEIIVSLNGISGLPNSNLRRISIRGAGMGATVLKAQVDGMRLMDIEGSSPLTSGSYGYMDIVSDISFAGNSPTSRTTSGLRVKDIAFARLKNVGFFNLQVGLLLEGALSSVFENLNVRENTTGMSTSGSSSHPNANTFVGCNWQICTNLAIDGYTGTSNATFIGCNIEGCGTQGSAGTGGVHLRCSGSQGEVALTFIGGYVENNRGDFDFLIDETSTNKVLVSFSGTNFQRVSSTNFVTSNIVTTGQVIVRTDGCAFTRAGTYVADAGRPYIDISALGQHISIGDRFEDAIEAPRTDQGAVYAGFVEGSLGASVTGNLPRLWSVSQISTGLFRITHNFGDTGYAPVATIVSGNARFVERIVRNANSFDVRVSRTSDNVAIDDDFSFVVQKFGGPT